ncbi:MAG: hypothetical protein GXC73_15220 [Chitinophagaceae bacterium]|nr:hypothetical protein [Chitinophagaceae bacterium]
MKVINTQNLLLVTIVFFFSVFTISSCRKTTQKENSSNTLVKKALEREFFTIPTGTDKSVIRIAEKLKKYNSEYFFIDRVVKNEGFPIWDKSLILGNNSAYQITSRTANENDTLLVFIPLSPVNTTEINGVFAGKVVGDSVVKINHIKESDYAKLGFSDSSKLNADNLISLLMYIQNRVFGTESFVVNDLRLFKDIKPATKNKEKLIRFNAINNELSSRAINSRLIEIEYCYKISGNTSNKLAASVGQRCDIYSYWIEDYTLPSFNDGDGDGGGGGNVGGGDSGGGDEGNIVISTQAILKEVLNLNVQQVAFLNTYAQLAEEIYNYINRGDGYLTFDECKAKAVSHINYCMESSEYFNFCKLKSRSFLLLNGWVVPWFHEAAIGVENTVLYSNIQQLKLDAKQAYYLFGNPNLNLKISNYLSNSNGQTIEEKKAAVAEHINGLLTNPTYAIFVQNYEATDNTGKMWWENEAWLNQNFSFSSNCPLGWCNLTQSERNFIILFPFSAFMIKINSDVAKNETRQMFGIGPNDPMPPNDKSNAFLHAFWCAMNLNSIGEVKARLFAIAHESETPQQLQIETKMDYFNNEVGFNIAKTQNSLFSNHVFQALTSGQLRYLKPVNYSDPAFWGANNIPETHGITNLTQIVPTNQ